MPKKQNRTKKNDPEPETPELEDEDSPSTPPAIVNDAPGPRPKATVVKSKVPADAPPRKIHWWVWAAAGVAVLLIAAGAWWWLMGPSTGDTNTNTANTNTPTGATARRVIDGVTVAADQTNPRILAVMIENAWESRPPSGLNDASVVYEALAEGGITRFMALFPIGTSLPEVGPVRSARQYYVDWAQEYKPLYVHVGGSPQSLTTLRNAATNVFDFNQFYHSPNFWRDRTRRAPHNLYTSSELLYNGIQQVARDYVPTYASWSFQDEAGIESRGTPAKDITIDFSSFNYRVRYAYDRGENVYQRYLADKAHVTRDGKNITVKNIVVQFTKTGLLGDDKQRLEMTTVGQGNMVLFRDGQVITGTWKKDSLTARTQFLDAQGQPLALNAGTTWIEIVPTDRKVEY